METHVCFGKKKRAAGALWSLGFDEAACAKIVAARGARPLIELAASGTEAAKKEAVAALTKLAESVENRANVVDRRHRPSSCRGSSCSLCTMVLWSMYKGLSRCAGTYVCV